MNRIWIRNGLLVDGTGAGARMGDIVIDGGRIVSVGEAIILNKPR